MSDQQADKIMRPVSVMTRASGTLIYGEAAAPDASAQSQVDDGPMWPVKGLTRADVVEKYGEPTISPEGRAGLNRCDVEWMQRSAKNYHTGLDWQHVIALCDIVLGNASLGEDHTVIGARYKAPLKPGTYGSDFGKFEVGPGVSPARSTTSFEYAPAEEPREITAKNDSAASLIVAPYQPDTQPFPTITSAVVGRTGIAEDTHGEWRKMNDKPG